jgi:hypothetical protein
MAEIQALTDTQFFWLIIVAMFVGAEVLKFMFRKLMAPLEAWTRAQNRKALRDKFAAHALNALISYEHSPFRDGQDVVSMTDLVQDAYNYADLMLEARSKKQLTEQEVYHG